MMTWEETIQYIRQQPEYHTLVQQAYLDQDLVKNVETFRSSPEWIETLRLLKKYITRMKNVLDIGSGNGITAVAFALEGYTVHCLEPDPSDTVGSGAIRWLKDHYQLDQLTIHEGFAEELALPDQTFDLVYARQCMHHARDLGQFVQAAARVLRPEGIFFTARDHVIFDEKDKKLFLSSHPLQKFYGGENAFTSKAYEKAMQSANLVVKKKFPYYSSLINYAPLSKEDIDQIPQRQTLQRTVSLKKKIGKIASLPLIQSIYETYWQFRVGDPYSEKLVPGRMYTYIAQKKTFNQ